MDKPLDHLRDIYRGLSTDVLRQEKERMHERAVDLLLRVHVVGQILQEHRVVDIPTE